MRCAAFVARTALSASTSTAMTPASANDVTRTTESMIETFLFGSSEACGRPVEIALKTPVTAEAFHR
jgi:hypothetical protein